jgi:hypothetical protein
MPNVIFTELVLHPIDSLALQSYIDEHCPMPEGGTKHLHHVTVKFRPTMADCDKLNFGEAIPMRVKGLYCDGTVAVFEVEQLHHDLPISNPIAHITAWTAENVAPRESNRVLAEQDAPLLPLNDLAVGTVSWFDGSDQEHKTTNPYPAEDVHAANLAHVQDGLRRRPWDSAYSLAYRTMTR